MPDRADEFGWLTWVADWKRRGELAVTIGLTALFTWLAAAVPTAHQTHVDIWPPIGVALAATAAGIYALVALERTMSTQGDIEARVRRQRHWWLPGKADAIRRADMAAKWDIRARDIERRTGGSAESDALNRIGDLLQGILARLPEGVDPTQQEGESGHD